MGRLRRAALAALAFGLGAFGQAQSAPTTARNWKAVMKTTAELPGRNGPATVVLLQSQETTAYGGADQPMHDVDLVITAPDGKVLYSYAQTEPPGNNTDRYFADRYFADRYFMDEDLRILDVTGDGVPEVLFHSGSRGASDWNSIEHILRYERSTDAFKDITTTGFDHSGRHGFAWLTVNGRTFAVVAHENWSRSVPMEDRCHYCPSPFRYDAYAWSDREGGFHLLKHIRGKAPYSESDEAIAGDRALLETALGKLAR